MAIKIFDQEIKEKQQQRHLLKAKSNGRRRSRKGFMLPSDYMSAAEIEAEGGEVVVTSLWDKILNKTQYDELTEEKKKEVMEHWRKIHSAKEIQKEMGITLHGFYKEIHRLGLDTKERKPRISKAAAAPKRKKEVVAIKAAEAEKYFDPESAQLPLLEFEEEVAATDQRNRIAHGVPPFEDFIEAMIHIETKAKAQAAELQKQQQEPKGSFFFLNEVLQSEEAISKLMKYAAFLEGEKNKFKIRLEIEEVKDAE